MDYKSLAIDYAVKDGGLTQDEAERAVDSYFPVIDSDYCQDCGCKLTEANTEDIMDEICETCWSKCLQTIKDLQSCIPGYHKELLN